MDVHEILRPVWLALGLEMSWPKASRGFGLDWIALHVSVDNLKRQQKIAVKLMENKHQELMEVVEELLTYKGVLSLAKLQLAVGILGCYICNADGKTFCCHALGSYHTAADAQDITLLHGSEKGLSL